MQDATDTDSLYPTTDAHRTTCPLKIKTMSRPFQAKFGGRCPLLGRSYSKGTDVRRVEFLNQDTGAEFVGFIPVSAADRTANTLSLMDWSEYSGFTRAKKGDDALAIEAMQAGLTVTIITRSGEPKSATIYSFRNKGEDRRIFERVNGSRGRTLKAYASSFNKNVVAWRASGYAFVDLDS